MRKGCLEMAVLATLWHGRLYGLEILRVLERDSSLVLAEGPSIPSSTGCEPTDWCNRSGSRPKPDIHASTTF